MHTLVKTSPKHCSRDCSSEARGTGSSISSPTSSPRSFRTRKLKSSGGRCGRHSSTEQCVIIRQTYLSGSPSSALLSRIQTVVRQGAKVPSHENKIEEIIALTGHFTRRDRSQYVVYARFGPTDPDNLKGHWRTVVLDTDLSIIATLGENEYSHIMPRSVGDVNGDGLDEIWADLVGYEGSNTGLLYWRPREP